VQKKGDHNHWWSAKWNRLEKVGCENETSSRTERVELKIEQSMDKMLDFGTNSVKSMN